MNLTKIKYTEILRQILLSKPIKEQDVVLGMHLFYGDISFSGYKFFNFGTVTGEYEDPVNRLCKTFKTTMAKGKSGCYGGNFDWNLRLTNIFLDSDTPEIYHEREGRWQRDEVTLSYQDQIFSVDWKDATHLGVPEKFKNLKSYVFWMCETINSQIKPDQNTLEFKVEEDNWKIVQRIPNGPKGSFNQLGYREIPQETWDVMTKDLNRDLTLKY
ncbi:MAG: hypothetical protein KAT77_03050 [Nanoarchaeota archaeon]|nr:hypothetical protein [Nanoarchaeota archaeon]